MNSKLPALAAVSLLALGLSACSYQRHTETMRPGSYESRESATDKYGTRTERSTSTEVNEDRDGRRKTSVTSKTTRDPKGMFNKTTTSETKETIEEKK